MKHTIPPGLERYGRRRRTLCYTHATPPERKTQVINVICQKVFDLLIIFNNHMLRRYLITFMLIIVIPTFLILALFLRVFESALVENLSKQSLESTQQIETGLNEEVKRIALLTSALAHDEELLSLLYTYHQASTPAETLLASRQIAIQLDTLFNYTSQIGAVFFFFTNEDMFAHRNIPITLNAAHKKETWYQNVLRGIGIRNVHERIRLNYGEDYGIQSESQQGQGTCITLRLPFIQEKNYSNSM